MMNPDFAKLLEEPDEALKVGLTNVDSRVLKLALFKAEDNFVEKLLRNMSKAMLNMLLDDLEEMREDEKHEEAQVLDAQSKVLMLYNKSKS